MTCLLVLTDLHYPGWRADVDGSSALVHRANALFRGVVLEPGTHEVVYRYEPRAFRIGAWLAVGSLTSLAIISLTLFCRFR